MHHLLFIFVPLYPRQLIVLLAVSLEFYLVERCECGVVDELLYLVFPLFGGNVHKL